MTGGYHTRRQRDRDRTLADRAAGEPEPPPASGAPVDPPRPCWIHWPAPSAGHVLAWQRDEDGHWSALVTAVLPQQAVAPRPDPAG